MVSMDEMVEAVKQHATAHYDEGGWDVIVETMDDEQIAHILRGDHIPSWRPSRSVRGAVERMAGVAAAHAEADAPHKAEREAAREETAKERKNRRARERRTAAA